MLGLKSLRTAKRFFAGIEAMHMFKKGQTLQGEASVQKRLHPSTFLINYLRLGVLEISRIFIFSPDFIYEPYY